MDFQSQIAQLAQDYNPYVHSKKGGKGGILSSLISEAGGTGGAIGGAAIGTGILPGIGTILGAGIGGFLGGTGGRVVENKVRDNRIGLGDALKEGAISGVMGAGPLRLAKTAGLATKGVVGGAGLAEAIVGAGAKTTSKSLLSKAGEKVAQEGDTLLTKSFRFTPSQLTNFKKKFGEDASQVIKKYGFTNADDIASKGVQPLAQQFDEIVGALPGVNRETLQKSLKSKYEPLLKSAVEDNVRIGKQLQAQADTIAKKYGDVIDAKELNGLRKEFDKLVNYTEKASNPARYGVNKRAADGIRTALQEAAESQGLPLKDVGRELNKVIQLSDLAAKQSNLGRGSLPIGLSNLMGGAAGGAGLGAPGAIGGMALTTAVNSNAGRRAIAKGTESLAGQLTKAGTKLAGDGVGVAAGRQLLGAGIRTATQPQSLEDALSQAQGGDYLSSMTTPNTNTTANSSMNPMNANMTQQYTNEGDLSSDTVDNSPFAPTNLEGAIMQIVSNGGTLKDVSEFLSVAKTVNDLKALGQPKQQKLNATQVQQSNNAQSALKDIGGIRQTLGDNPKASLLNSLPGGNFTRNLTGTSGYEASRQNVADALGRLRSGGAINKDEEKRFLGLLPGSFDSPEVAEQKLTRLEELFNSFAYPDATAGSLEDALMQYQ